MKLIATTIFLILSYTISSQTHNSYTAFIQLDTSIKWAAECNKVINLSPKVSDYSLKKWYMNKLKSSFVTAYRIDSHTQVTASYRLSMPGLQRQKWLEGLSFEMNAARKPPEWNVVDKTKDKADDQRFRYTTGKLNETADSCCGCDETDAFRAKQIITYKNGRFNIYNVFISPLCARQDSASLLDWYPLCNVAYNSLPNEKVVLPGKGLVLLNTEQVDYDFNNDKSEFDSVLTVYRPSLIKLLMQDLQKGKIKAIEYETGENISDKNFTTWKMTTDTIPVYEINDPTRIARFQIIRAERNLEEFHRIRIIQDHYFDFKKEKLYSVIKSVIMMVPVKAFDGRVLGYRPFCRLTSKT